MAVSVVTALVEETVFAARNRAENLRVQIENLRRLMAPLEATLRATVAELARWEQLHAVSQQMDDGPLPDPARDELTPEGAADALIEAISRSHDPSIDQLEREQASMVRFRK